MKKYLACLAIMLTALLLPSDSITVTAQKKEKKSDKEPAIELKNLSPEQQELLKQMKEREEIASKLKFKQGEVKLKDGLATLKVPADFRYLDPDQTDTVLVQLWHNPPRQARTLGMLFPAGSNESIMESWGVVITYNEDGYVEDDEASSINYNDLLKEMKEGTRESNQERTKMGYDAVELIGWAAPPHYDKAAHKLYWAKELSFGGETEHTLNYDIRALGRRGVLSLNAVASMDQLQAVEKDMKQLLTFVEFNDGHRYSDYVAGADKVAAYGIGALIVGKVAAKAGLFKLLLVFLAKGWKLIIVAIPLIGAFLRKLISGRRKEETAAPSTTE
jgi:uncharacterized membrane-anchored protein